MPHQDINDVRTNHNMLKGVLDIVIESAQDCARHGNATMDAATLASIALVCWGWTNEGTITERVDDAVATVNELYGLSATMSRQGVMNALVSCGNDLRDLVVHSFEEQVRQLRGCWRQAGRVNFAVDGTKFAVPRTEANQASLAARPTSKPTRKYRSEADASKSKTCQLLVTTIWHIGSGLSYRWTVEGSSGSERVSLAKILDELPGNARMIGDAEYVGYPLWSKMITAKVPFVVRVGSNVHLLKNLGELKFSDGYVYFWPEKAMRRNDAPIILKLTKLRKGKETIYLVTNELELSDHEIVNLYQQRWGIEVFFRSVKQSCGRAKLCCKTPDNAMVEVNWTLLGIWAALFTGSQVLKEDKVPIHRLSPIKVIRAFRRVVVAIKFRAQDAPQLREEIANATKIDESDRVTSKSSRNYPAKKKLRRSGPPIIAKPTKEQKKRAKIHLE